MVLDYIWSLTKAFPTKTHDWFCERIQERFNFNISESYVAYLRAKVLNIVRKRASCIALKRQTKRVRALRHMFRQLVRNLELEDIIFIDESHFSYKDLDPKHAYFQKGQKAEVYAGYVSRKSFSLLAAISINGLVDYTIKDTEQQGVNTMDFIQFLEKIADQFTADTVLFLDNARIHKTPEVIQWARDNDVRIFYSAPYSPDYNPIELLFAQMKYIVKREKYNNLPLQQVIQQSFGEISEYHYYNYVMHAHRVWEIDERVLDENGNLQI
ncbi:YIS5 [Acrasis kona]|uniref:YIS5 n=1 Tax=Acrasis kona TaxID=1008807 RepID=A0AAW2ZGZ4_9EUKA